MKTLFAASLTLALSSTVVAKPANIKFVAMDQNYETQLCLAAAQEGLEAAENLAASFGINDKGYKLKTKCNGESLVYFARKYEKKEQTSQMKTIFKLVVANEATESKICAFAASQGIKTASEQYGYINNIICNDKPLTKFARRYKAQSL